MKKSTQRWMSIIALSILGFNVLAVVLVFILKPVHTPQDLFANGRVSLDCIPNKGTYMYHAHAYPTKDKLRVKGCIHRKPEFDITGKGKLEITLLSPDNNVLDHASVSYSFSSDASKSCGHFATYLHTIPPEGSTAIMEWGLPSKDDSDKQSLDKTSENGSIDVVLESKNN